MTDLPAEEETARQPVTQSDGETVQYRCADCKAPIIRGDRCVVCWRGWFVEVIPS